MARKCQIGSHEGGSSPSLPCYSWSLRDKAFDAQEDNPLLVTASSSSDSFNGTYQWLIARAAGCTRVTDLWKLPSFHFVNSYDYLIVKTAKYNHARDAANRQTGVRALQFFEDGHIKSWLPTVKGSNTFVKAEVLASMKMEKYAVQRNCSWQWHPWSSPSCMHVPSRVSCDTLNIFLLPNISMIPLLSINVLSPIQLFFFSSCRKAKEVQARPCSIGIVLVIKATENHTLPTKASINLRRTTFVLFRRF